MLDVLSLDEDDDEVEVVLLLAVRTGLEDVEWTSVLLVDLSACSIKTATQPHEQCHLLDVRHFEGDR